jgi:hypothetical protein
MSLPFHGVKRPVLNRMNGPLPRQPELQRTTTSLARLLLPRKDENRRLGDFRSEQAGGLFPLLLEKPVDG